MSNAAGAGQPATRKPEVGSEARVNGVKGKGEYRRMDDRSRSVLSIDAVMLIALSVASLWLGFAISAMVVTLVIVYVLLATMAPAMPDELDQPRMRDRLLFSARLLIVTFIVLIAAIVPTGSNILLRRIDGPGMDAHDGLIQTEVSIDFLLHGKNPYAENYLNTPMADSRRNQPPETLVALYHNAYLPFLFIGSMPFYLLSQATLGWFDERFVFILLFIGTMLLLPELVRRQRDKLLLLMLFGLNLFFNHFLAEGRNDIVMLFGFVLLSLLLVRRHVTSSALVLGCLIATKHPVLFFVPFYLVYLLPEEINWKSLRTVLLQIWPMLAVPLVFIVPFIIWDPGSFFDDTVSYIIGTSPTSYPIWGWGFSELLLAVHVIPTDTSPFPFGIFEALFGLPLLVLLVIRQRRENTLQQVWIGCALLSLVVEYFSRFFNDNYVIFALQLAVIAAFILPARWHNPPMPTYDLPSSVALADGG